MNRPLHILTRGLVRGILGPGALLVAVAVALASCAELPAADGDAEAVDVGALEGAAAGDPAVEILSPPNNTSITFDPAGTNVTLAVAVDDAQLGSGAHVLRYYLDGVEVHETTSTAPYTFVDVPFGMHHFAARLLAITGDPLPNPESLDAVYVKLLASCDSGVIGGEAVCEDGLACTAHSCNSDLCNYGALPDCCDSELQCDYGWYCVGGTCIECLADDDCDDGNVCTDDLCGVSGLCIHTAVPGCCESDGDCDDGDYCNVDSCNVPLNECEHVDAGIAACCNVDDDCVPENPCQAYLCYHNTIDDYKICRYGPHLLGCCTFDGQCYDGNPCTLDTCVIEPAEDSGLCAHSPDPGKPACCIKHSDCDDSDPSTDDACIDNGCVHEEAELFCALPESSLIVINELMVNPGPLADGLAEWIELYNTSLTDLVDLEGWTVETSLGQVFEIGLAHVTGGPAGMAMPPGGHFVLARSVDPGVNGGFFPNAVYGDAIELLDPDEVGGADVVLTVRLKSAGGVVIDELTYDSSTWPIEYGRSLELTHPFADNALGSSWRAAGHSPNPAHNKTYGPHKLYGSPKNDNTSSYEGLATDDCTPPPDAHPCAEALCDLESRCFFEIADGCCSEDVDCDDFDICTEDTCDAGTQTCGPSTQIEGCCNFDSECVDDNPCNIDRCLNHECRYTPNIVPGCCTDDTDCDDGSACTINVCDVGANACEDPVPIAPSDGSQCCLVHADCEDDKPWTLNLCGADHLCDFPGDPDYCDAETFTCDDGNPCTDDACDLGENVCQHVALAGCCQVPADCADDGDPCTATTCQALACGHDPIAACCVDHAECDDDDACTVDACGVSNTCHSLPIDNCCTSVFDCDDGVPCTQDLCTDSACEHEYVGACCTPGADPATLAGECGVDPDGDFDCWTWTCNALGACLALQDDECCAESADCDDGNVCTLDLCPTDTQVCKHLPLTDTGCCQDDSDCPEDEYCSVDAGACVDDVPPGNTCESDSQCQSGCCTDLTCAPFLDDGEPCTVDGCVCASGFCVDGFCCDAACDADCETCSLSGAEGACSDGCQIIGFDIDSAASFQRAAGESYIVDWFLGWGPGGYVGNGTQELEWGDFPPGDDVLGPP